MNKVVTQGIGLGKVMANEKVVLTEKEKRRGFLKKFLFCLISLLVLSTMAAITQSSGTISELEDKAGLVMDLFSGKTVAVIMCIALMICFAVIAWANAQGEGASAIKKVMPWVIAVIGIGSAAGITSYFLGVSPN